jgi:hypothetical protein
MTHAGPEINRRRATKAPRNHPDLPFFRGQDQRDAWVSVGLS